MSAWLTALCATTSAQRQSPPPPLALALVLVLVLVPLLVPASALLPVPLAAVPRPASCAAAAAPSPWPAASPAASSLLPSSIWCHARLARNHSSRTGAWPSMQKLSACFCQDLNAGPYLSLPSSFSRPCVTV
jgi:hypothetical protein